MTTSRWRRDGGSCPWRSPPASPACGHRARGADREQGGGRDRAWAPWRCSLDLPAWTRDELPRDRRPDGAVWAPAWASPPPPRPSRSWGRSRRQRRRRLRGQRHHPRARRNPRSGGDRIGVRLALRGRVRRRPGRSAARAAEDSIGAALGVAEQIGGAPGEALRQLATAGFFDGLEAGCLVAAGVCWSARLAAAVLLPAAGRGRAARGRRGRRCAGVSARRLKPRPGPSAPPG